MDDQKIETPEVIELDLIREDLSPLPGEAAGISGQLREARERPRDLKKIRDGIIFTATLDEETADSCSYALPRADKIITGPSVGLANIVIQLWGNVRMDLSKVSIDDKYVTCRARIWDLENNFAMSQEVLKKITDKKGNRFSEDLIVLTTNSCMSIAKRNVIFSVVPKPFWNAGLKAAREMLIGDTSTNTALAAKREEFFKKAAAEFSVTNEEILLALKVKAIGDVGPEELQLLRGFGQAIRDGDASVNTIFRPTKESFESSKEVVDEKLKQMKERAAKSKKP